MTIDSPLKPHEVDRVLSDAMGQPHEEALRRLAFQVDRLQALIAKQSLEVRQAIDSLGAGEEEDKEIIEALYQRVGFGRIQHRSPYGGERD